MELLREGGKVLGLTVSAERVEAFERYYQELVAWNSRFNLTAITEYADVQCRHFLDSLSCLLAFPRREAAAGQIPDTVPLQMGANLFCLDVGSGAGFPGLPIKIMLPDIQMTLLEATGKKVTFLEHMVGVLGLAGVRVIHGRAEEIAHDPEQRGRYDVVLARAVAALPTLAEYCLPYCRVGGRFVAQKGEDVAEEIEGAQGALEVLGGAVQEVKTVMVPGIPEPRTLVVVAKTRPTPHEYPRRPGVPTRRPLG